MPLARAVAAAVSVRSVFMQRALVAGLAVGVFAPMIGDVPGAEADVADRRRHRPRRFRRCRRGIDRRHLARSGRPCLRGGRGAGVEWLRARRRASGDLALALFFYSGIALGVVLASLGGGLNASLLTICSASP